MAVGVGVFGGVEVPSGPGYAPELDVAVGATVCVGEASLVGVGVGLCVAIAVSEGSTRAVGLCVAVGRSGAGVFVAGAVGVALA